MKLSRKIIIPVLLILILVIGFALVNRGAPAAEEGDSLQLVSQTYGHADPVSGPVRCHGGRHL